jgi:glycosyltransferase involved in cell wall biosynthesis
MKKVAILTDFVNFDPAYSLCRVVQAQVKMLARSGYKPRLLVRTGFAERDAAYYDGAEIAVIDPGKTGSNVVEIRAETEGEIENLTVQLMRELDGADVVLTHDLLYQANMWKYHVAARRFAAQNPEIRWLHWVHSATNWGVADQTGKYRSELRGAFLNSKLVAMHREEISRKGAMFGYEQDQIVVVPNAVDFCADFHPAAVEMVRKADLMSADVIALYPCRLDRGKQPHIIAEIFHQLSLMGYDARVVIADFHSVGGDKKTYRKEMKKAHENVFFTSDIKGCEYCTPHKAIMDLFEVADILVHPSMSESDPLILPEAMWKRCGLVLNFDLPVCRQYDGVALMGKFSSAIDVNTGMPGETTTDYGNRRAYMTGIAAAIAYQMENNPVLALHAKMRKERSLGGAWPKLWAAIEG